MQRALVYAVLLVAAAATAQADPTPEPLTIHEIGTQVGLDTEPLSDAELSGPYLRPLDDADPEMQQRTQAFFDMTPCGGEAHGVCREALQLLIDGGDRLAYYLILQIERNEGEGFPNRGTYLHLLGYTESDAAFSYLADLFDERRAAHARGDVDYQSMLFAIEALGNTRRQEVVEKMMPILEAEEDSGFQIAAVNALDRVQVRHGPLPSVETGLRALEQRNASRRAEAHARSSEQLLMTPDPFRSQDPWREVQQRIDMIRSKPGHMRP